MVVRPARYLRRRVMLVLCKVFEKHNLRFLIGGFDERGNGDGLYSCRYCGYTETQRW